MSLARSLTLKLLFARRRRRSQCTLNTRDLGDRRAMQPSDVLT